MIAYIFLLFSHRLCYRTTVDKCENGYIESSLTDVSSMHGLLESCPLETQDLRSIAETEKLLQSPRYGCRKGRGSGNHYGYRRSDFCLYNVSIPT